MIQVSFLLPAGSDSISGGNLYNKGLLMALGELPGVKLQIDRDWPTEESDFVIVDTLDLPRLSQGFDNPALSEKLVLLVHHLPSLEPGIAPADPALRLEKTTLPMVRGLVATSVFCREYLIDLGIPEERVVAIEPAIRHSFAKTYAPEKARYQDKSQMVPLRALSLSNLIPRKGILRFLQALEVMVDDSDRFALRIRGRDDLDANYAESCKNFLRSSSLSKRVSLLGPCDYSEVPDEMSQANCYLSPSLMETFGIALQEASFFALPILCVGNGNSKNHIKAVGNGESLATPEDLARTFLSWVRQPERHQQARLAARTLAGKAGSDWPESACRLVTFLKGLE